MNWLYPVYRVLFPYQAPSNCHDPDPRDVHVKVCKHQVMFFRMEIWSIVYVHARYEVKGARI